MTMFRKIRARQHKHYCVAPPGDKGHPPGFEPGSYGSEPILNHYATQTCIKVGKIANYDHGLGLERGTENQKDNAQQLPTCSIRPNKPAPKTPPINKTPQITPNPSPSSKNPLKPARLATARLRPTESRAFGWKENHLFPTWWAKPPKKPETSVIGNSAALT